MTKEYVIYCDESVSSGKHYSDFYGGALVASDDYQFVNDALEKHKSLLGINEEIKWTKTNDFTYGNYLSMMDLFFQLIDEGKVKVRIMFRQSAIQAINLTYNQVKSAYFLLYYQFIKHAFGLQFCNQKDEDIYIRLYYDELPDSKEKSELFKNHIYAIQSLKMFENAKIKIRRNDIQDVNSKNHIILQCLDVVLGSMAFRLNDQHKEIPEGKRLRGKRTVLKGKLYKHINFKIRGLYPNFNIGNSTSVKENMENKGRHPYRHWCFIPKEFKADETKYK